MDWVRVQAGPSAAVWGAAGQGGGAEGSVGLARPREAVVEGNVGEAASSVEGMWLGPGQRLGL